MRFGKPVAINARPWDWNAGRAFALPNKSKTKSKSKSQPRSKSSAGLTRRVASGLRTNPAQLRSADLPSLMPAAAQQLQGCGQLTRPAVAGRKKNPLVQASRFRSFELKRSARTSGWLSRQQDGTDIQAATQRVARQKEAYLADARMDDTAELPTAVAVMALAVLRSVLPATDPPASIKP